MKRRLTKLVVFLLLGAIVNVAVAWGCAAWIDVEHWTQRYTFLLGPIPFEDAGWQVAYHEKPGAIRIVALGVDPLGFAHWREVLGADVPREELERAIEGFPGQIHSIAELKAHVPSWSRTNHPPRPRAPTYYPIEDARGWPIVSLRCSIDERTIRLRIGDPNDYAVLDLNHGERTGVVEENSVVWKDKMGRIVGETKLAKGDAARHGILLPVKALPRQQYDIRALPLRPIWPGFAINTILYAAILWLLALGPFTARRMIRRKRGRCIKCGYNLRGDFSAGCPECGWRREAEG